MTWLPSAQRVLIPGALGMTHHAPVTKLCWHTTEGSTTEGAVGAYTARKVPPHLTVDPGRDRITQHVPLDRAAYALHAVDQTGVVQVEIVGYARDTHLWPEWTLEWLGRKVAAPILAACPSIDRHACQPTYGQDAGFVLASPASRIRLDRAAWDGFSGQLGHQHAPAPNHHWDPGRLNLHRIGSYARIELEDDDMFTDDDRALLRQVRAVLIEGEAGGPLGLRVQEIHEGRRAVVAKGGGVGLSDGDVDKIAERVADLLAVRLTG